MQEKTAYAAIFRAGDEAYLQVAELDSWDFDATSIAPFQLDDMKASEEETHAIYDVGSRSSTSVSKASVACNIGTVFAVVCLWRYQ